MCKKSMVSEWWQGSDTDMNQCSILNVAKSTINENLMLLQSFQPIAVYLSNESCTAIG